MGGDGAEEECSEGVCGANMKNLIKAPMSKTIESCPRKKPCVKVRVVDILTVEGRGG